MTLVHRWHVQVSWSHPVNNSLKFTSWLSGCTSEFYFLGFMNVVSSYLFGEQLWEIINIGGWNETQQSIFSIIKFIK